ncbi:hypothetical protein QBC34DRAFT_312186, partial [Podospora aff. communis PSN243]
EINKTRQHVSAGVAIFAGLGLALFTMGKSLMGTAYGARRLYVADGKLELVQAELRSRGEDLHEITARDVMVPLGTSFAAFAVGHALGGVLDGATGHVHNAINSAASHCPHAVTNAIISHPGHLLHGEMPGELLHGAIDGVELQAHEVASCLADHADAAATSAAADASIAQADPVVLKGIALGVKCAHSAEVKVGKWVAKKLAARLIDRKREPDALRPVDN